MGKNYDTMPKKTMELWFAMVKTLVLYQNLW